MQTRSFSRLLIAAAVAALSAAAAAQAAGLGPQVSQAGGVAIEVTPTEVGATAKEWTFAVALNTHSQALTDDLVQEGTLVDAAGKPRAAIGWDGDPPGGHHRRGVLHFAPVVPKPAQIEVHIRRASESEPRTFRWTQ
jgi:hypothetical protein